MKFFFYFFIYIKITFLIQIEIYFLKRNFFWIIQVWLARETKSAKVGHCVVFARDARYDSSRFEQGALFEKCFSRPPLDVFIIYLSLSLSFRHVVMEDVSRFAFNFRWKNVNFRLLILLFLFFHFHFRRSWKRRV